MTVHHQFSCGDVVDNRYQLDLRIHEGRWGDILKATDRRNERPVAIRFFSDRNDQGELQGFEEFSGFVLNLAKITAPGLGIPIDCGQIEGGFYIVSRWAHGQTLEDRLGERGPLNLEIITSIVEDLLAILSRAHQLRLPHGLLRPSKIVVDGLDGGGDLHVSLVDFQIWRLYELATGQEAFEESKLSRRIIRYTGPEVVQNHRPLPATDLFSLGLVILEMLRGTPFLDDNHRIALIARQLDATPIDLDEFDIGPGLKNFLSRCLEKKSTERLENAMAALELFQKEREFFHPSAVKELDDESEEEGIEETVVEVSQPARVETGKADEPVGIDVDEELFGRDPAVIEAVSEVEGVEDDDFLLGNLDRDDLFGDELDFGGENNYEEKPRRETGAAENSSPSSEDTSDGLSKRMSPNSSLIDGDLSDEMDFEPGIADGIASVGSSEFSQEESAIQPTLVEAKRITRRPSSGPSQGPAAAAGNPGNIALIVLVVAALLGGGYFFLSGTGDLDEIQRDGEISDERVDRTGAVIPTYQLRVTTNPPALRVQVQGHEPRLSPVEVRVRESDFPLRVRARMDSENILETTLAEPTTEYHFDFTARD